MMKSVTVIDYGVGNLLSVERAFRYFDASVEFATTPEAILAADRLVLPGVGAFSDAMQQLSKANLVEAIQAYSKRSRPFLGICLGMQMMLSRSHEFGVHEGLNLIEGEVVPIPSVGPEGFRHKIPHIGWGELKPGGSASHFGDSILNPLGENPAVYFVHSFQAEPANQAMRLANTHYHGLPICAAIRHEMLYGCQFHPEKSGRVGLQIIENFLNL